MSAFTELNQFSRNVNGVHVSENAEQTFDYSDGAETEAKLHRILSGATDLSSSSSELLQHISDWPTEYHLSTTRANLLRPLDLTGVRRVLELGCGCGSITRYLGEHSHITVDAIEGSPTRAGLAALRCRDLENVSISVANFNDVKFPEGYYDLVLFVGVTEYAGRFSARASDQEALQDLLALGQAAASDSGVTLIAIENRLGLKYMLGANEDHYAVRYIGLDNYPKSTGIRTYSRTEWRQQINESGFSEYRFMYPFPDYKVPTLVVSDGADQNQTLGALAHIRSRDYNAHFDLGDSEPRAWQGLLEAGNFADHANSFLILLGNNADALDRLAAFDIARYPAPPIHYRHSQPVQKAQTTPSDAGEADRLLVEIRRLKAHAASLEARIDLILNSLSWRVVSTLRRLFGKTKV